MDLQAGDITDVLNFNPTVGRFVIDFKVSMTFNVLQKFYKTYSQ